MVLPLFILELDGRRNTGSRRQRWMRGNGVGVDIVAMRGCVHRSGGERSDVVRSWMQTCARGPRRCRATRNLARVSAEHFNRQAAVSGLRGRRHAGVLRGGPQGLQEDPRRRAGRSPLSGRGSTSSRRTERPTTATGRRRSAGSGRASKVRDSITTGASQRSARSPITTTGSSSCGSPSGRRTTWWSS